MGKVSAKEYLKEVSNDDMIQIIVDLHKKRNTGDQDPKSKLVEHYKKSGVEYMMHFEEDIYHESHERFSSVVRMMMINAPYKYIQY